MTNKFFLMLPAPASCFPLPVSYFFGRPIPPKMHLQKWGLRIYRIVDNPKLYSLLKAQVFNRPAETNHLSPEGPTHFRFHRLVSNLRYKRGVHSKGHSLHVILTSPFRLEPGNRNGT